LESLFATTTKSDGAKEGALYTVEGHINRDNIDIKQGWIYGHEYNPTYKALLSSPKFQAKLQLPEAQARLREIANNSFSDVDSSHWGG
jgi:hypothetical protein